MQDKRVPGALTASEFEEMMQEFADAGEWMTAQLRSRSDELTYAIEGDEERPDPKSE